MRSEIRPSFFRYSIDLVSPSPSFVTSVLVPVQHVFMGMKYRNVNTYMLRAIGSCRHYRQGTAQLILGGRIFTH